MPLPGRQRFPAGSGSTGLVGVPGVLSRADLMKLAYACAPRLLLTLGLMPSAWKQLSSPVPQLRLVAVEFQSHTCSFG